MQFAVRRALTVVIAAAAPASLAGAQARASESVAGRYRIERFTSNNGLPQNTVAALAQTPDGYLWVATFDGLARYDGVAFTVFDRGNTPAMQRTQFLELTVDGSGALWAGTDLGNLRVAGGDFSWFGATPGSRRRGDIQAEADPSAHKEFVQPPRARWNVVNDTLVGADSGGAAVRVPLPGRGVHFAGEDRSGVVWMHTTRLLISYARGRLSTMSTESLAGDSDVRAALVDRDGTIWLGTIERGLFRVTPAVLATLSREEGLYARYVYPVTEDSAHRIWIAAGDGLSAWKDGRFKSVVIERIAGQWVLTPARNDSTLGRRGAVVRALHVDAAGQLWVSVAGAVLTLRDGRIVAVRDLHGQTVDAMLVDRADALWVAIGRDIRRIAHDSTRTYTAADGYPGVQTNILFQDSRGTIWAGTRRGLASFDGTRWKTYRQADGLAGDIVRSIHEDSSGALWFGTFDAGISRLKHGTFRSITTRDGLFSNDVFQILEDRRGTFWMSGNRGIFRASRAQLDALADGAVPRVISVAYGAADGMKSTEANGGRPPAGVLAHDGRLWFPTTDGVVVIDPAAERLDAKPPVAVISRIVVDADARPSAAEVVRLAPGETNLTIAFTAPTSVHAAQVQFRYRFRDLDAGWTESGTTREVQFSHLPPGRYTFDLVAASSEGVWARTPTTVQVVVEPHFWQTTWFTALVVLLLGGGGAAAYRARVAGLQEQERTLSTLVAERTAELRVANERLLHLAIEDPLTRLANRRRFDEFLAAEWHRAVRAQSSVALLVADVDHFKKYNDTYGHPAGDACLRAVAGALAANVRAGTDLAARIGGEEFAVVLTDTDADGARIVAEKIRGGVAALGIEHRASGAAPVVTVSVGVASVAPGQAREAASFTELIAAADRALYTAKEEGRNRVR